MKVKNSEKKTKQLEKQVWQALSLVLDPELGIDVVTLGLIYRVTVNEALNAQPQIDILMTLTTPGCPLADSFDGLVRQSLASIPTIDVEEQVSLTLTFDPPWTQDMMSDEAKAELGMF